MISLKKTAVIIPAFNEIDTIAKVVNGALAYTDEVIVVDDGSSDGTYVAAKTVGAKILRHNTNLGYDVAIEDGFKTAMRDGCGIFITFDADGQHNAEDIPKLIEVIVAKEADIVIGQRPRTTHFCEKLFALYTKLRFGIRDPLCGLKAYSREAYEAIGHFDTLGSIGTQLMLEAMKKGFTVSCVPIQTNKRPDDSRFYSRRIIANLKILRALLNVILKI